jgi:hypothetical protein
MGGWCLRTLAIGGPVLAPANHAVPESNGRGISDWGLMVKSAKSFDCQNFVNDAGACKS